MKKVLLAIGFCLSAFAIQAQDSASQPIDLVADSGFYDQMAGVAVYEGNVRAKQGAATIWADKVTITLKNNAADSIVASSQNGKLVRFEYLGDKKPIRGQGQKAVYKVPTKMVELSGNAQIVQGQDVVKGNKLIYDLAKEIIQGSRVRMTFLPGSK